MTYRRDVTAHIRSVCESAPNGPYHRMTPYLSSVWTMGTIDDAGTRKPFAGMRSENAFELMEMAPVWLPLLVSVADAAEELLGKTWGMLKMANEDGDRYGIAGALAGLSATMHALALGSMVPIKQKQEG